MTLWRRGLKGRDRRPPLPLALFHDRGLAFEDGEGHSRGACAHCEFCVQSTADILAAAGKGTVKLGLRALQGAPGPDSFRSPKFRVSGERRCRPQPFLLPLSATRRPIIAPSPHAIRAVRWEADGVSICQQSRAINWNAVKPQNPSQLNREDGDAVAALGRTAG